MAYGLYDLAGNVRQIGDARPNMDQTFTYDPLDRLAPNRTYTYTPQNMLATATVFGAQTQFAYDADNWRFSKTSADGTTLYFRGLNGELLTEWRNPGPNGETRDYIYAGAQLISMVKRPNALSGNGSCGPLGSPGSVTIPSGGLGQVTFCGVQGQTVSASITLTSGAALPVSLTTPGQTALVTFAGSQGQTVGVPVTGNTLGQTYVYLRRPDTSVVA